ncbi:MAG: response regulator [Saprospiraceae bacterium]
MSNTILLLEDDKNLRETLVDIFEFKGFEVITATNGVEALKLLDEIAPNIIVSDVMMPEMDGFEFLKRIKENPQTEITPVIMVTANTLQDAKYKGLEYGANDYITKPFDTKELLFKVQNLIKIYPKQAKATLINPIKVDSKENIFVEDLKSKMLECLADTNLTVEQLAKTMFLGKSTFQRKIKKITGFSANEYIRTFRLEYAYQLLEQKAGSASDIATKTGFRSLAYFSYAFKQHYGKNPSEVGK